MKQSDRVLKKYLSQVKKDLPCTGKQRVQILNDLKNNIADYLQECPEATIQDVQDRFGAPETITHSCIEQTDYDVLMKKMRIRKIVVRVVLATAAVVVLLWTGVVAWAAYNEWNNSRGYTVDTIDIIEEEIE